MNFLDLPIEYSNDGDSLFAIISVPFDLTSTWKKGADKGPQAIINASQHVELFDIETQSEAYTAGIFTGNDDIDISSELKMVESVYDITKKYLSKNKIPILLGGEHSITIGSAKACAEHFNNFSVLQLDAHTDLRDNYNNSKYNHACAMARVKEHSPIVQIGIRSTSLEEQKFINSHKIFYAKDIFSSNDWIKKAVKQLNDNVYITIDLDVFDPSIMPSTGTPEPGGLDWYTILNLLKTVLEEKNIIGFDIVELCPTDNHAPDFLAAKLIYKIITYIYNKRG